MGILREYKQFPFAPADLAGSTGGAALVIPDAAYPATIHVNICRYPLADETATYSCRSISFV